MSIRIATFNMENLFRRPTAFRIKDPAKRKVILDDFATLAALLDLKTYGDKDRTEIERIIKKHRAYDTDPKDPPPIFVNQPRFSEESRLFNKSGSGKNVTIQVIAAGRASWAGWAELGRDDLDLDAVHNTGRVVSEVDADILLTVEVEDRLTLERFNTQVLAGALGRRPYPYALLIDGNDPRGIDIGILSRHPITSIRTHVFDTNPERPSQRLFSRDCPEFEIQLNGTPLVMLGNHLKSKSQDDPELRLAQAERVAEIYRAALERTPHVIVAGDLNDHPDSDPAALLRDAGLRDVMSHRSYHGLPGTYGECKSEQNKIDYLLLSPELWPEVQHVGLETRGISAEGIKSFDSVTSPVNAASDHAALYTDVDL
ncbi:MULTISPECIES: endonuclease/exonuclease/phosphatase family protein [unclassified Streptomyces]|uniref:endonuclease/exonuclease/phosphatase family protein n=1 Tax=unclassified Streptomyces TaxID=2593676 RepID=UPI000710B2F9|nr:endonuclease/exonuclease/phosphatase family protein [Streptomyces sp. Root1310]KQX82497.1 hydrolase [Streptomyces sp. Root1310]